MTLRDHFAAAALTGLLATGQGPYHPLNYFSKAAYEAADAMLRERCRSGSGCPCQDNAPNLDAAPAAIAPADSHAPRGAVDRESVGTDTAEPLTRDCGTGKTTDRPQPVRDSDFDRSKPIRDARMAALEELVALDQELELTYGLTGNPMIKAHQRKAAKTDTTQPRNGTPAKGSVQGERSVPDSRNANEPVAWAVMYPNGEFGILAFYRREAEDRATASDRVVPLYRSPTLTDAERSALWDAAEAYAGNDDDPECERIATALQGPWQRTK